MKTIHVIKFSLPVLVVGMVTIGLATAQSRRMQGLASGAWPKARGDAQNTGRGYGAGAVGVQKWVFAAEGPIANSPVVGPAGLVYFGSEDKNLYALDIETGELVWKFETWGTVRSTPAIGANGLLYFGSAEGRLYALDAKTGKKRWQWKVEGAAATPESIVEKPNTTGLPIPVPTSINTSPTIAPDGTVYIVVGHGSLFAFDGVTGAKKWEANPDVIAGTALCPALSVKGDTIYFAGHDRELGNCLLGLDALTQAIAFKFRIPNTDTIVSPPILGPAGMRYYSGSGVAEKGGPNRGAGILFAYNRAKTRIVWRFEAGDSICEPALGTDGTLYATVYGDHSGVPNGLMAVDGETGEKLWQMLTGKAYIGPAIIGSDGTLYAGSSDGNLRALDSKTGSVKWTFQTGNSSGISPAIAPDGTVFAGSADGKLYAIK